MAKKPTPGAIQRELSVKLNDKELRERGEQLAKCDNEIRDVEQDRAAYSSKCNKRIKELKADQTRLCNAVDSGSELRLVDCHWHDDLTKNERFLTRDDTGEEVDRRPMTADELQAPLPGTH